MRSQRSRNMRPSNRQVHQGMIAIVARLGVLSVFMLVLGVTSTTAQTGQDERCADFTGQAHGLCTAAVSEGCFDGVESQACDDLTTNWNERCRVCEGTAPWVLCPCGSAAELYAAYEFDKVEGEIVTNCDDNEAITAFSLMDSAVEGAPFLRLVARELMNPAPFCLYSLVNASGFVVYDVFVPRTEITPEELEACREDIRVIHSLTDQCDDL